MHGTGPFVTAGSVGGVVWREWNPGGSQAYGGIGKNVVLILLCLGLWNDGFGARGTSLK